MADAYETDLARIPRGHEGHPDLARLPEPLVLGRVAFIESGARPKTRTTKVHLHFSNSTRELKPEMYGEVALQGTAQEGLRIPADAVISRWDQGRGLPSARRRAGSSRAWSSSGTKAGPRSKCRAARRRPAGGHARQLPGR